MFYNTPRRYIVSTRQKDDSARPKKHRSSAKSRKRARCKAKRRSA